MIDPALGPRPAIVLSETTFSKYVSELYGRPYQLQQQGDMLAQESSVALIVPEPEDWNENPSLAEWLAATPPEEQGLGLSELLNEEMRWERQYYPSLEAVGNDLHARGLLDVGYYIIHVSW